MSSFNFTTAANFKYTGIDSYTKDELDELSLDHNTLYDERMSMISKHNNFSDIEWYANYLNTASDFARKNPDAYASYLLDLGFIPVVYVPSCCKEYIVTFVNALNQQNIPYVRVKATSFVVNYFVSDIFDAWVHKFDIQRILGIQMAEITSSEVVRRLYGRH